MLILIDPGHGIDTPGKRSPDGKFLEYLWNRQIADLLLDRFMIMGIDASLVVTETNDISLATRVQRVNRICSKVGASNVILLSIHSNAAGNGSQWMNAKGWSCYTSPGQTESDKVAEFLYKAFEQEFAERRIRTDYRDGDKDWEENFYILTKTACPAVLLENFFYDNRDECKWLLQEDTKKRVALAASNGIFNYLKHADKI